MTSGFKKIIIIIFIVFAVLLSLAASVVFFPKERNRNILNQDNQQEERQLENSDKKTELTDEEKVKAIAENFTTIYYSYSWGNFSNIESLKDNMTQRLWNEKSEWINTKKEKLEGQPAVYAGISSIPKKTDIIDMRQSGVKIEIECEQYEIEGASIYINGVLAGVDISGRESFAFPIYRKIENKKIRLELLREGDEWKVDEIGEK